MLRDQFPSRDTFDLIYVSIGACLWILRGREHSRQSCKISGFIPGFLASRKACGFHGIVQVELGVLGIRLRVSAQRVGMVIHGSMDAANWRARISLSTREEVPKDTNDRAAL